MSKPALLVVEPIQSADKLPLLLVLHGNNSTNALEKSYWEVAHQHGWLVAFCQSSQIMNPGRYMWNNLTITVPQIQGLFAEINDRHALDMTRIVIGGFSRGAFAGLWMCLGQDIPATSFIGVAPVVPDVDLAATRQRATNCPRLGVQGYLLMGEDDPYGQNKPTQIANILRKRGMTCEIDLRPNLGHTYPPDFSTELPTLLARFSSRYG